MNRVGKPGNQTSVGEWREAIVRGLAQDGRSGESVVDLNPWFFSPPKTRRKRGEKIWRNEREFSRACFKRIHGDLAEKYPELLSLAFHVPNENSHHEPGVVSGVPDICIDIAKGKYRGLRIELKCANNKCSKNQNDIIAALRASGHLVYVVWDSVDEVVSIIESYMKENGDERV